MQSQKKMYAPYISIISLLMLIVFATIFKLATLLIIPRSFGENSILFVFFAMLVFIPSCIITFIKMIKERNQFKDNIIPLSKKKVIFSFIIFVILFTLFLAMSHYYYAYGEVDGEQLVYHLLVNADGMDTDVIIQIAKPSIIGGILFSIALSYIYITIFFILSKNDKIKETYKITTRCSIWTSIISVLLVVIYFCNIIPIIDFIQYQFGTPSTFIDDNYIDPKNTNIEFPERKRNLIYIYMESMENTFMDTSNGGAFKDNMMPEITNLLKDNISFSNTNKFGGAVETYGMTYTTAGMVANSFGLPLKIGSNYQLSRTKALFPELYNIYDIMNDAGYQQCVLMGSEDDFGGLEQLFNSHGKIQMYDYNYFIKNGYIDKDYKVFWGIEDAKLYEFAKEKITDMSKNDAPFFATIETVDTHSPNGYFCEKCERKYNDQYSNVIACASKQVSEFIEWAKTQEWYENTTIIVVGDHLSMKNEYFTKIDDYTRTTLNLIINPHPSLNTNSTNFNNRTFNSADMFPTTLAAIGCIIEGDRLGLGTNLFSDKPTLFEELGFGFVNEEFKKKSEFYENVFQ